MPEFPGGVVLPDYARLDLAWEETRALQFGNLGQRAYVYTPASGYIDIPRMVFYRATTGVEAGARSVLLDVVRADGLFAFEVLSPIPITTASTDTNYSHMVDVPVMQTVNTNVQILPLPSFTLGPGDRLEAGWGGGFADDVVSLGSITVVHVPTGPPISYEIPPELPRPTPLLA